MAQILPPPPVQDAQGTQRWIDWFIKINDLLADVGGGGAGDFPGFRSLMWVDDDDNVHPYPSEHPSSDAGLPIGGYIFRDDANPSAKAYLAFGSSSLWFAQGNSGVVPITDGVSDRPLIVCGDAAPYSYFENEVTGSGKSALGAFIVLAKRGSGSDIGSLTRLGSVAWNGVTGTFASPLNNKTFSQVTGEILVADGSGDPFGASIANGAVHLEVLQSGSMTTEVTVEKGTIFGAPTNGVEGAGTISVENEAHCPEFHVNDGTNVAVVRVYTGDPNSNVTGSPGDIVLSTGGGSGTTLYVKESGSATNTGWVGK